MAEQDRFFLTEADVKFLRQLKTEHENRRLNTPNRFFFQEPDPTAPEVHVALSPHGGIPGVSTEPGTGTPGTAASFDRPGSASCKIFQLVGGNLKYAGFKETVNNLSTSAVPAFNWVQIKRDKFGDWWVEAPATGSTGAFSGAQANTLNQNLVGAGPFDVAFDGTDYDTDSYFDLGTDNTLITAPTTDYYEVGFQVEWSITGASATRDLQAYIDLISGTVLGKLPIDKRPYVIGTALDITYTASSLVHLLAGSTLKMSVNRSGGSSFQVSSFAWISRQGG